VAFFSYGSYGAQMFCLHCMGIIMASLDRVFFEELPPPPKLAREKRDWNTLPSPGQCLPLPQMWHCPLITFTSLLVEVIRINRRLPLRRRFSLLGERRDTEGRGERLEIRDWRLRTAEHGVARGDTEDRGEEGRGIGDWAVFFVLAI